MQQQSSSQSRIDKLITPPHEHIRESISSGHKECAYCGNKTEYACIKCGYCYSCHWKREQLEEIELRDNLKDFYLSMSNVDDNNQKEPTIKQQASTPEKDRHVPELEKWETKNVLGQPAEPICTYYRCHHKFSLHGTRSCRCKHPMNKTLGIAVRYG
jgi:hypothetical protein